MSDRVTTLRPQEMREKHNNIADRIAAIEQALVSLDLTGGSTGDVLTQQADGTFAPETPT